MSEVKQTKTSSIFPIFLMGSGLFVLIQGLALLAAVPFQAEGLAAFSNPSDPANLVFFLSSFLISTLVILLVAKFRKKLVEVIILGAVSLSAFSVILSLLTLVVSDALVVLAVSAVGTAFLIVLLLKFPEWYVVDACGILLGLGATALLGISLSIFLVIILLAGLAVYDAISVYKTKHMIDLADVVLDLKLPLLLVIPRVMGYSLIKETTRLKDQIAGEKREAFIMGLGDVVMPGILVVSTFSNIPVNGIYVAFSVMIGTLCGFALLTTQVIKGKPQAGLPLLCGGAILGYLVSSYLLFGGFSSLFL
jgi:presenilin-like A22 family membrane protease